VWERGGEWRGGEDVSVGGASEPERNVSIMELT
jgi:hypothetical protein